MEQRVASLFRNGANFALRIPKEWIDPDGDIRAVELIKDDGVITVMPIDPATDAELFQHWADEGLPQEEVDAWDSVMKSLDVHQPPQPVEL